MSYDPSSRRKYLALPTHQRRLRHLRSVAARNLSLPPGTKHSDVSHIQCYFTLHTDVQAKEFYTSEFVRGSLNPIWRSFDFSKDSRLDVTSSYVIVRIWLGQGTDLSLRVEWKVDLTGLAYLGEQIVVEGKKYPPNSVVLGMWDGYFGLLDDPRPVDGTTIEPTLELEQSQLRPSYSMNMLNRVYSVLRAIKQTEALVNRVRQSIEDQLVASKNKSKKLSEHEMLTLKVSKLRYELEGRSVQLNALRISHEQIQAKNHSKDSILHNKNKTLAKDRDRLQEKKKGYFEAREKFVKANAQLIMRKKQLIAELAFIYPVLELTLPPPNPNSASYFTICGVRLPNSEDFQGHDETMVAVGLGYTAHMVAMIAQFLDVPLRYPIQHKSAKSKVHDHITDKLLDKDRDFPLYSKGKDKFHFNYAVYLLNKNIAQVRYYCGMGTNDLRLSLPNLKALLEMRLGVKFEEQPDVRTRKLLSVITSGPSISDSSGNPSPISISQPGDSNPNNSNGAVPFESVAKETKHGRHEKYASSSTLSVNSNQRLPPEGASSGRQHSASPSDIHSDLSSASSQNSNAAKFVIDTLHDHVDSTYSKDKSKELPSTERFDAQFIKPDSVTRSMPGFRNADICDIGDGSSSDDNTASKYSAKFKTWQRNPALQDAQNLSDNESKGAENDDSLFSRDTNEPIGTQSSVSASRTFKTKVMMQNKHLEPDSLNTFSQELDVPDPKAFHSDKNRDVFLRAESFDTGVSSFNTIRNIRKDRSDSGKS